MKKLLFIIPFLLIPAQVSATSAQSEDACFTIECTTTEYKNEVWHEASGFYFITKLEKAINWLPIKPKGPRMCLNEQERVLALSNMATSGWRINNGNIFDDKNNYRGVCGSNKKETFEPIISWAPVTNKVVWYKRWMTCDYWSEIICTIVPTKPPDNPAVPEPNTLLLFGTGVLLLTGYLRNKKPEN